MAVRRSLSIGLFATALFAVVSMSIWHIPTKFRGAVLGNLFTGWFAFIKRVLPELDWNRYGVAFFLLGSIAFVIGSHWFLSWLSLALNRAGQDQGHARKPWRFRSSFILYALVIVSFVAGLAATGFVHQIGWLINAPEPYVVESPFRRETGLDCENSEVFFLGLVAGEMAVKIRHSELQGSTVDAKGIPIHSWASYLIANYSGDFWNPNIDYSVSWRDPKNASVFRHPAQFLMNPRWERIETHNDEGFGIAHFSANSRLLPIGSRIGVADISAGTANTLMIGEAAGAFKAWGDPENQRDPFLGLNTTMHGFGGPAADRSVMFGMADGSVRSIHQDIDPIVLRVFSTGKVNSEFQPSDLEKYSTQHKRGY